MGNKLANCKDKGCQLMSCEEQFFKKIVGRRKESSVGNFELPSSQNYKVFIQKMKDLADYVFEDQKEWEPVMYMKEHINTISSRDISSMMSFLAWENEFLDVMKDENNQGFNFELENKRTAQFMKIDNNLLVVLLNVFDQGILLKYQGMIDDFLKKTCQKYDTIGYKKKTPQRMINFIANMDPRELESLKDPADRKVCLNRLKEILGMVKKMGRYISMLIAILTEQDIFNSKQIEYSTTTLIINCMLKYNFSFYVLSMFLSRIMIADDIVSWSSRTKLALKNQTACDDLMYLKNFITNEKDQKILRQFTKQNMNLGDSVSDGRNYNLLNVQNSQNKMDMTEFLGHVNHHLKLNLDQIFFSNLSDIMFFFNKIEEFMDKVFNNAELEIKIDLIRVILRVNESTDYFHRIFIITLMELEFLSSCQIFALFNEVLIRSELKSRTRL